MRRAKRPAACKHKILVHTFTEDGIEITSSRCSPTFGCGATLSLGPSNDEPEAVCVEMRAVEISACTGDRMSDVEAMGYGVHPFYDDHPAWETKESGSADFSSGWLASEINTHDDAEQRDLYGWPWDPSHPLAGQYEEWISRKLREADDAEPPVLAAGRIRYGAPEAIGLTPQQLREQTAAAVVADPEVTARNAEVLDKLCAACTTSEGCAEHEKFTCEQCGSAVSWDDGADDEGWGVCSDCWVLVSDANDQALHDGCADTFSVVELLTGPEPEVGVEFEIEVGPCDEPQESAP